MSVTIDKVQARRSRETMWNQFLASLEPRLRIRLFASPELELVMHDDFVDGKCSIRDVRLVLTIEPNDPEGT